MNLTHLGSELRRFGHGKLPPVALLTIIVLPLLFGGLFVWSYWDPVGRINQLPVAYVNSDTGARLDGKELDAGEQITERLMDNDQVSFTQVSAEEARAGVADGTYYFAIEIPENFSEYVAGLAGDDPHPATLNTLFNNDNGLIATTLGNQVVTQVLAAMNSGLGEQVTDNLLVGFNTIGSGVDAAADGAGKLADGASTARGGAGTLADGSEKLRDGIESADAGASKLAEGAQKLDSGLGTAAESADQLAAGLAQLQAATDQLGSGAAQISGGVDQIGGLADQATQAQQQLLVPLINLSTQLKSLGLPQASAVAGQIDAATETLRTQGLGEDSQLVAQLGALQSGAAEVARQLTDPAAAYLDGMQRAAQGSQALASGLHQLHDGSTQLVIGANQLSDGTSQLVEGSQQLTVGATQLADGLVALDDGNGQLALKLTEAGQQIPSFGDEDARAQHSGAMSTPVVTHALGDSLPYFGKGLAPIFISLGLFLGGTITWMVFHPLQRRAVDSGMAAPRVVLASYLPALLVGLSQATVMFAVQKWALNLDASHEVGMWAAMCLTAATFQMITLGINAFLGTTVGRVVCIALMSLQIVSSGGLYPPETQPAFLRWFHNFDPMTYSTNLLRQMIFHADTTLDDRLWQGVGALALCIAIFGALALIGARRARSWSMKDLHPEVSV